MKRGRKIHQKKLELPLKYDYHAGCHGAISDSC